MPSLPNTRPDNPANGSPVGSVGTAEVYDSIIKGAKNITSRPFIPSPQQPGDWIVDSTPYGPHLKSNGAVFGAMIPVPIEVTDRVLGFHLQALGNGVIDVTHSLIVVHANMTQTTIATSADVNRAAAWGTFTPTPTALPYTMLADETLYLLSVPNAAGYHLGNCTLIYDRPLP